jgi:hypothetical protein
MWPVLIIGGGLALLYFGARPGSAVASVLTGATHGTVKLGNADPNFEPWLADEITKLMGPPSNVAGFRDPNRQQLADGIRARRIPNPYVTANSPGGAYAINAQVSQAGGLAIQGAQLGASIAGATVSAIPIVGSIFSVVDSVLNGIFAGHQAAVQRENTTLRQWIPAVNGLISQIDQAYRTGQLNGSSAGQALEQMYQSSENGLAVIIKPKAFDTNPLQEFQTAVAKHQCNAACVFLRILRGIVDAKVLFDY